MNSLLIGIIVQSSVIYASSASMCTWVHTLTQGSYHTQARTHASTALPPGRNTGWNLSHNHQLLYRATSPWETKCRWCPAISQRQKRFIFNWTSIAVTHMYSIQRHTYAQLLRRLLRLIDVFVFWLAGSSVTRRFITTRIGLCVIAPDSPEIAAGAYKLDSDGTRGEFNQHVQGKVRCQCF